MKKFLLSLLLVTGVVGYLMADASKRGVPQAYDGTVLQMADYGGYNVSTAAFSAGSAGGSPVGTAVNFTTACCFVNGAQAPGSGVVSEVYFTTGSAASQDFVTLFDATSTDKCSNDRIIGQWYNVTASTLTNVLGTAAGSSVGPKRPVRFKRGLIYRCSTAVYNLIQVYFNPDSE